MIKFGTGGWRAVIGEDFTKENVQKVARGIAILASQEDKRSKPIFIGYDNRYLSQEAAIWVAEVLGSRGMRVIMTNQSVPTPLTMFMVQKLNLFYGIEITASHNPANYNGIKLFTQEGRDASVEITQTLERLINFTETPILTIGFKSLKNVGIVQMYDTAIDEFTQAILKQIKPVQKPLKILVDPMHGSGYESIKIVLEKMGCEVDFINEHKDVYFGNRLPAPTPETLTELQSIVVQKHYDLGIALDGDGDRLGIIDSNGQYITANEILCLLYYYLYKKKGWKGPVVRNYATTHMLDRIAESFGEICYEVPIGFKYISSKIDEVNAVLGGESSGGLTVRGHIHGKDSIYAAALFVEMVSETKSSPTTLFNDLQQKFGRFIMVETNLSITLKKDLAIPTFKDEIVKINQNDGCKIYFKDGFVIYRASGTEPLVRVFAEAPTEEKATEYLNVAIEHLKR
jgi:phosphomannomutase